MTTLVRLIGVMDDGTEVVLWTSAPPSPPIPPVTDVGKWGIVVQDVRLRTEPTITAPFIRLLKHGTIGQISTQDIEQPDYVWWEVTSPYKGYSAAQRTNGTDVYWLEFIPPDDHWLPVPYVSQLGSDALAPYDCGQACVLMLHRYYYPIGRDYTPDLLSKLEYGKTTAQELVHLGSQLLPALQLTYADMSAQGFLAWLRTALVARPVIALVDYKMLGLVDHLAGGTDQGLHWLVIIGYSAVGDYFTVHDPLWSPAQREGLGGALIKLNANTLLGAMVWNTPNVVY